MPVVLAGPGPAALARVPGVRARGFRRAGPLDHHLRRRRELDHGDLRAREQRADPGVLQDADVSLVLEAVLVGVDRRAGVDQEHEPVDQGRR